MQGLKNHLKFIPNTITCLNLASGCFATIMALEGDLKWAAGFIFLGAAFDFFDGLLARVLKAFSSMGKELDSLADMVTFGIAPGMIIYNLQQKALFGETLPVKDLNGEWWQMILLFSSFLIPVFSGIRLAKFNIDQRQTTSFIGMPTPSNAIFWAAIGILSEINDSHAFKNIVSNSLILALITVGMSLLLIAEFPMFSLKFNHLKFKGNQLRFLLIALSIGFIFYFGIAGIPLAILSYIALSLFENIMKKARS